MVFVWCFTQEYCDRRYPGRALPCPIEEVLALTGGVGRHVEELFIRPPSTAGADRIIARRKAMATARDLPHYRRIMLEFADNADAVPRVPRSAALNLMTPAELEQLHDVGLLYTTEQATHVSPKLPVDLRLFNELERDGDAMSFSLVCLCRTTHGMGGEGGKYAELCVVHRHRRKLGIEDCPHFHTWEIKVKTRKATKAREQTRVSTVRRVLHRTALRNSAGAGAGAGASASASTPSAPVPGCRGPAVELTVDQLCGKFMKMAAEEGVDAFSVTSMSASTSDEETDADSGDSGAGTSEFLVKFAQVKSWQRSLCKADVEAACTKLADGAAKILDTLRAMYPGARFQPSRDVWLLTTAAMGEAAIE